MQAYNYFTIRVAYLIIFIIFIIKSTSVFIMLATRNMRAMSDNLEKLRRDQSYLQSIIVSSLEEVASKGTIASLVSSVNEYINNKSDMEETVKR